MARWPSAGRVVWPRRCRPRRRPRPRRRGPRTWQLEAVAGIGDVSPDDLNARAVYDAAWLNYLRTRAGRRRSTRARSGSCEDTIAGGRAPHEADAPALVGRGRDVVRLRPAGLVRRGRPIATPSPIPRPRNTSASSRSRSRSTRSSSRFATLSRTALLGFDVALGRRLRLGGTLAAGWGFADCTLRAPRSRRAGSMPPTAAAPWR